MNLEVQMAGKSLLRPSRLEATKKMDSQEKFFLTRESTQHHCCVTMIPDFDHNGKLPPGIHWATWDEIVARFGWTPYRRRLLNYLKEGLLSFKLAGCQTIYVDGSFITSKEVPGDFDCCWDENGVNPHLLDPVLLDFSNGRATQKAKFMGEFFPATCVEGGSGKIFLDFFAVDKDTGDPKGLVAINLRGL